MSRTKDFLSLHDAGAARVRSLLDLAAQVKEDPGRWSGALQGRTLAMIFEKPSLRTRTTFEAGMAQMGGHAIHLASADIAMGSREPVRDVARNLDRWVDAVCARVFDHHTLLELAEHAGIPVINALSDLTHPCQVLADLLTLRERWGVDLAGRTLAWLGDGNNVCHSLAYGCAAVGMHLRIGVPQGYEPRPDILEEARWDGRDRQVEILVTHDPAEAVRGADAVYTDVWASMGQEEEADRRRRDFRAFQVNAERMAGALSSAVFLHCLPAHRGEEVTEEVLEGDSSVVFDQAENRLHAQKALLLQLLDAA